MLFSYMIEFQNRYFGFLFKYDILLHCHILWWLGTSLAVGSIAD